MTINVAKLEEVYIIAKLILAISAIVGLCGTVIYYLIKNKLRHDFITKKEHKTDMDLVKYKTYDRDQLHNSFVEKGTFKTTVLNFDEKIDSLKEFIRAKIEGIENLIKGKNV